jgi:hypothetical protein
MKAFCVGDILRDRRRRRALRLGQARVRRPADYGGRDRRSFLLGIAHELTKARAKSKSSAQSAQEVLLAQSQGLATRGGGRDDAELRQLRRMAGLDKAKE